MAVSCMVVAAACLIGCSEVEYVQSGQQTQPPLMPDTREPIPLSASAGQEHRTVMLQHLETIQVIVNALAEENYDLARGLTESHVSFFRQRQPFPSAHTPGVQQEFPPAYHDLAMAHHEAAEDLARIIPTQDLKQILPRLNTVLKACVACHLEFKINDRS